MYKQSTSCLLLYFSFSVWLQMYSVFSESLLIHKEITSYTSINVFKRKFKQARAALESSSKRGSFQRIFNCQEFWSKWDIWHIIREYLWWRRRFWEEESTFRHQTFDFCDLGSWKEEIVIHEEKFRKKILGLI